MEKLIRNAKPSPLNLKWLSSRFYGHVVAKIEKRGVFSKFGQNVHISTKIFIGVENIKLKQTEMFCYVTHTMSNV